MADNSVYILIGNSIPLHVHMKNLALMNVMQMVEEKEGGRWNMIMPTANSSRI